MLYQHCELGHQCKPRETLLFLLKWRSFLTVRIIAALHFISKVQYTIHFISFRVSNILFANVLLSVLNLLNPNIKNLFSLIFLILRVRRICFKINSNNFLNTKQLFESHHHFSTFLLLLYLFSKDVKWRYWKLTNSLVERDKHF